VKNPEIFFALRIFFQEIPQKDPEIFFGSFRNFFKKTGRKIFPEIIALTSSTGEFTTATVHSRRVLTLLLFQI
jgi:hypothetical protein